MNQAYNKWGKEKNWNKQEFWDHINFQEKIAVALGNLNYQVENGGFEQWNDNGYYEIHCSFLVSLLTKIPQSEFPLLKQVLAFLEEVESILIQMNSWEIEEDKDTRTECLDYLVTFDTKYYALPESEILKETSKLVQESEKY